MGEPYFVWKGVDSRAMRVWVQQLPPIVRPPMRYQSVTIPGRPGALTLIEGQDVYDAYVREMRIMPKPNADIHAILCWLTGSGEVVFSCEEHRIQKARIYDEASMERQFADQRSAVVRFLCDPFKGERFGDQHYTLETDAEAEGSYELQNRGDVRAYPFVTLTASGTVSVFIDGTELALSGLDENTVVTIDHETRMAYKTVIDEDTGTSSIEPVTTHGDYSTLRNTGVTSITWTAGISALEIVPRWRWF